MAITKKQADLISAAARLQHALQELHDTLRVIEREPRSNAKKLTADEVASIRQLHQRSSLNQREIAEAFDVNPATVSRIVRGVYHGGQ